MISVLVYWEVCESAVTCGVPLRGKVRRQYCVMVRTQALGPGLGEKPGSVTY